MAYTLTYELIDDNAHYRVTGYTGTADNVVIPETYNGKTVTEIKFDAFKGTDFQHPNTDLISIVIPDSVTKIGTMEDQGPDVSEGAFAFCSNLETVVMSKNLRVLGRYTFAHCAKLRHVSLPNTLTDLGGMAFENSRIDGLVIPNSVRNIGEGLCKNCTNLVNVTIGTGIDNIPKDTFRACPIKEVSIPSNIVTIGQQAFWAQGQLSDETPVTRDELRTVIFSEGLVTIGRGAFGYQSHLNNFSLPQSLVSIELEAFWGCEAVSEVIIPTGVTFIGYGAFHSCTYLETVTVLNVAPCDSGTEVFDGDHPNLKIYVYSAGIDAYKGAVGWARYANKTVADDLRIDFLLLAKSTKQFVEDKTGTSVDADFFNGIYSRV